MATIRDIQSEDDMLAFRACELSIILMTPEWSIYPKKTLTTLKSILPDVVAKGIQAFTPTEGDPAKNRPFIDWLSEHDEGSFSHVGAGAGELIICRRGNPVHVEVSTASKSADELRTIIVDAFKE